MNKPSFVVTGSTGFIGKAVTRQLRSRLGERVDIVALDSECDLRDARFTFEAFQKLSTRIRADYILHLAARAPSGVWLANHPAEALYSNTLINANLFEASRRYFPDARVISTLSYSIYPPSDNACSEDQVSLGGSEDNLATYAESKIAVLTAQTAYLQQYGLQAVSVVLPTVYGFNHRDGEFGQAIPSMCRKFLDGVATDAKEVVLWGDGQQERDFLYIEDAADGIIASAFRQTSPLINLGSGQVFSIQDVARRIAKFAGFAGNITFDEKCYSGPDRRCLNTDKAWSELNWSSSTSLDDGLEWTIDKMRAHMAAETASGRNG